MAPASFGGHNGAVASADPHPDAEIDRRRLQPSERLHETKAGFLVIGEDMPLHGAAALRGEPHRLSLGDQIADRQHQAILADQNPAAGAFGAECPGGKGVLRDGRAEAEDGAQRAVQIERAIRLLRLDLARYLPIYGSRHFGGSFIAGARIITTNLSAGFTSFQSVSSAVEAGCSRVSRRARQLLDNPTRPNYVSSTLQMRVLIPFWV